MRALLLHVATVWILLSTAQAMELQIVRPVGTRHDDETAAHEILPGQSTRLKVVFRDDPQPGCSEYRRVVDTGLDGRLDEPPDTIRVRNGEIQDPGTVVEIPSDMETPSLVLVDVYWQRVCDGAEVWGTQRFRAVGEPLGDAVAAQTPDQRRVVAQTSTADGSHRLWSAIHIDSGDGVTLLGHIPHERGMDWSVTTTASAVWAFALNGHLPAHDPDALAAATGDPFGEAASRNRRRWRDPYARKIMAMVNWLVSRARMQRIDGADEAPTCGYEPDGTEMLCERLRGTSDSRGVVVVGVRPNSYVASVGLVALSIVTPALHDLPIFVGPRAVRNASWPALIQQMVDYVGYLQHDAGSGIGSVYYGPLRGQINGHYADTSVFFWMVTALATADEMTRPYHVIVNNRIKYRPAWHMVANQHTDGGGRYRNDRGQSSLVLSAANALVARWLGIDTFDPDDETPAWPPHVTATRGELRQTYDRYLAHIVAHWRDGPRQGDLYPAFLFAKGEPTCGDPDGESSAFRCQHVYGLLSVAKMASFGETALDRIGPFDWQAEFDIALTRAFDPRSGLIGSDLDAVTPRSVDTLAGPLLNTAFSIIVMSRTMQWPLPVAVGRARVAHADAGCEGRTRTVRLSHGDAHHPSPERRIVRYDWDFDDRDGLAWQTQDEIDASTADPFETVAVTYVAGGQFRATLRVTDDARPPRSTTHTVTVAVDAPGESTPVANAGGPYYTWPRGDGTYEPITLTGAASVDLDAPCGDGIVDWAWDLDADGQIDAHTPVIGGHRDAQWRPGLVSAVRLKVVDTTGRASSWAHGRVHVLAAPPARGEIVESSPAQGDHVSIHYRVWADAGAEITATLYLDARLLASRVRVGQGQDRPLDDTVVLDVSALPDGAYALTVEIEDAAGHRTRHRALQPVMVDRQAPVIRIDPQFPSGLCTAEAGPPYVIDDAVDPAPTHEITHRDFGCAQLSVIEATDAAGNHIAEPHTLFRPQPPAIDVQAPPEGALVDDARITWQATGPASCTTAVTATLTVHPASGGSSTQPYAPGTSVRALLPGPGGTVRFDLVGYDCASQPHPLMARTFTVNAPPTLRLTGPERIREGEWVEIAMVDTAAPEPPDLDWIVEYALDLNGDGRFEYRSATPITTRVRMLANGERTLHGRVTDRRGAQTFAQHTVQIDDVAPSADAGGSYAVAQGAPLRLTGVCEPRRSLVDQVTAIRWTVRRLGGGPVPTIAAECAPTVVFDHDGIYFVTLHVTDEDNTVQDEARVVVHDVAPQVTDVYTAEPAKELLPVTFVVEARPGAAGDPLVSLELDPGDGSPVVAVENALSIRHVYPDAGRYIATLRLHDIDSPVDLAMEVQVAELTLLEHALYLLDAAAALQAPSDRLLDALGRAIWGERHHQRGTTVLAYVSIVDALVSACTRESTTCDLLWPTARTLTRAIVRMYDETAVSTTDDAETLEAAATHVDHVTARFFDADFVHAARRPESAYVVNDLMAEVEQAFFFLRVADHPCNRPEWRQFTSPIGPQPGTPTFDAAANAVNNQVGESLATLALHLQNFIHADFDGPGRSEAIRALFEIRALQSWMDLPVGVSCHDEPCIDDADATKLQLQARKAARALAAARSAGVYVDDALVMVVRMMRYRIALSLLRLESVCPRTRATVWSRAAFEYGLSLFDHTDTLREATHFYLQGDLDCLTVDAFQACFANHYPRDRWPDRPGHCEPAQGER